MSNARRRSSASFLRAKRSCTGKRGGESERARAQCTLTVAETLARIPGAAAAMRRACDSPRPWQAMHRRAARTRAAACASIAQRGRAAAALAAAPRVQKPGRGYERVRPARCCKRHAASGAHGQIRCWESRKVVPCANTEQKTMMDGGAGLERTARLSAAQASTRMPQQSKPRSRLALQIEPRRDVDERAAAQVRQRQRSLRLRQRRVLHGVAAARQLARDAQRQRVAMRPPLAQPAHKLRVVPVLLTRAAGAGTSAAWRRGWQRAHAPGGRWACVAGAAASSCSPPGSPTGRRCGAPSGP